MKKAITLIEIIVAITIISILAAIAIPNMVKNQMVANESAAQANLKILSAAVENYVAVRDQFPSGETNLTGANPPYLDKSYCGVTMQGYSYSCTFTTTSYSATATPSVCRRTGGFNFAITNGGNLTRSGC